MRSPSPWTLVALTVGVSIVVGVVVLTVTAEDGDENFVPPTPAAREAAIGSLERLAPVLRRAFAPGDDFEAIPAPGPRDWLAHFPEPGQSFDAYVASEPNRPDAERRFVYVQPLGTFDTERAPPLKTLKRLAAAFFVLEVKLLPPLRIEQLGARSRTNSRTGKRQLRTGDVLEALRKRLPSDAYCSIGVTMEDLYPNEEWNFVFGQASLKERVGVYSFVRYDPAFSGHGPVESEKADALVLRRSCKVLAHETSHMFGLHHCIHYLCMMNGSNHLEESDSRPLHLCPVCLRKLHHATEFDVAERYEQLASFCREAGLDDEAGWYAARRKALDP